MNYANLNMLLVVISTKENNPTRQFKIFMKPKKALREHK